MPSFNLTDITIRALKADRRTDFWDAKTPSFGIRVGPRSKTFIVKRGGSRLKLGEYPALSLQEARRRALGVKSEKRPTAGVRMPMAEFKQLFLKSHCRDYRPRTRSEAERLLKKLAPLDRKLASDVTTDDIMRIVDKQTAPSEATHVFKIARTLFRFGVRRRILATTPLYGLPLPSKQRTRSRVLSNDELRAVWKRAGDDTFGTIVKMLILTGQRRGEIAAIHSSWLSKNTLTIPGVVSKNGLEHSFPLSQTARSILKFRDPSDLPNDTAFIFPARGRPEHSFNGWSKGKAALDKASGVRGWVLHDLRRTFATIHARIGTPPHVIERLLNHQTGIISGVAAIYNRYSFMNEMRTATEAYEAEILRIVSSPE